MADSQTSLKEYDVRMKWSSKSDQTGRKVIAVKDEWNYRENGVFHGLVIKRKRCDVIHIVLLPKLREDKVVGDRKDDGWEEKSSGMGERKRVGTLGDRFASFVQPFDTISTRILQ